MKKNNSNKFDEILCLIMSICMADSLKERE